MDLEWIYVIYAMFQLLTVTKITDTRKHQINPSIYWFSFEAIGNPIGFDINELQMHSAFGIVE